MTDRQDGDPLDTLLDRLASAATAIDDDASDGDPVGRLPEHGLSVLHRIGALSAPLPRSAGGLGLGTEPTGAIGMLRLLRAIGGISLPLGRLYEGHVNALKLIVHYGTRDQIAAMADAVGRGGLCGIWVTEAPPGLRYRERPDGMLLLEGVKQFASGAARVSHPLVTALSPEGEARMVLVPLVGERRASPMPAGLSGMRGAATGAYDFTGLELSRESLVGAAGDYLRQPEFSAGAWRGIAVALGGMDRLLSLFCSQLAARGREGNPHQQARIGQAAIARETAALWAGKAALVAEGGTVPPADVAATVNLARIAVERAALDLVELVQRGLGLSAFLSGTPVERTLRDLATYLRQPAPDETLTEGGLRFCARALPDATPPC